MDYARVNGFLPAKVDSYTRPALRGEVAALFAASMPPRALSPMNTVEDDSLPDVKSSTPNSKAIYQLYRAGIMTGNDNIGTFRPNTKIKRSEVATLAARIADPSLRLLKNYFAGSTPVLSPVQIAEQCSPAVFTIWTYDAGGKFAGQASGFFLTSDGLAVTNAHVVAGCSAATVITLNSKEYSVEGVYSSDKFLDLAIIKVKGTGFPTLPLGDPTKLKQGEEIYSIGSPLGLGNTFSVGYISKPRQILDGVPHILFEASVAPGSSGGALINNRGQVVGVTAGIFDDLGTKFAMPVDLLTELQRVRVWPLATNFHFKYYPGCGQALNFEYFSGAKRTGLSVNGNGSLVATYSKKSLGSESDFNRTLDAYRAALLGGGMSETKTANGWVFSGKKETLELTIIGDAVTATTAVQPVYYAASGGAIDLGWYLGLTPEDEFVVDGDTYYFYDATELLNYFQLDEWLGDYYFAALEAAGLKLEYYEEGYGEYGFESAYIYANNSGMGLIIVFNGDSVYAFIGVLV